MEAFKCLEATTSTTSSVRKQAETRCLHIFLYVLVSATKCRSAVATTGDETNMIVSVKTANIILANTRIWDEIARFRWRQSVRNGGSSHSSLDGLKSGRTTLRQTPRTSPNTADPEATDAEDIMILGRLSYSHKVARISSSAERTTVISRVTSGRHA